MNFPDRSEAFKASGRSLVTDPAGLTAHLQLPPVSPGQPVEPNELLDIPSFVVLKERTNAGLTVELCLSRSPISGVVFIRVTDGEAEPITTGILGEQANDAFEHPYCYLPQ